MMTPPQRLLRYFPPHRARLSLGTLCVLGGNLLQAAGPLVLQRAIDALTGGTDSSALWQYAVLLVLVTLGQGIFSFFQRQLFIGTALVIESDLRDDFYRHLQKLPLEFFKTHRTGDLMARATSDLAAVRVVVGWLIMDAMHIVLAVAIILPMMARINWQLAMLLLFPILMVAASTRFIGRRIGDRSGEVQEGLGQVSSHAQESFSGVRTIRAYNHERTAVESFRLVNRRYLARSVGLIRWSAALYCCVRLFIAFGFMAALWHGGNLVIADRITVGEFVQFVVCLEYLTWPIWYLSSLVDLFERGMASMRRIHSIMSLEPAITDALDRIDSNEIAGRVEFRNLTFQYDGAARPALRGINLTIEAGKTVAIVGTVGAGKSTLLNLVPRLLDAEPGQVLIDDHPIRQVPLNLLRSSIGYVTQECFLFSDSVASNIAFGKQDASLPAIELAAKHAGIAEEIARFPSGYKTFVGERGVKLSGGQKQRLTLARALIREPAILLLDDALSSVDADTEEEILKHLRDLTRGRTCLITSHRISTVKDADLIVVLDQGRVAEQGTHEELLARQGLYAELYGKQLLSEELGSAC